MKITLKYNGCKSSSELDEDSHLLSNVFDRLQLMLEGYGFHRDTIHDMIIEIAGDIEHERNKEQKQVAIAEPPKVLPY